MKPPPFQYYVPENLDSALQLLKEFGSSCRILAGGQSLVPDMNFRKICPEVLIDINQIGELQQIEIEGDWLILGAGVRQAALARCEHPSFQQTNQRRSKTNRFLAVKTTTDTAFSPRSLLRS